ncbi:1-deoxy-D-xylulose-5-phosphate reductoisomerase [Asticcacaulis solisilvae]|uniref:1-deoxy-D-xylulose-5-phosphate reductoisomerase n=1 Tax=Asticcacaulis solisilvae TaxID=1217274 RepID=UPI003FD83DD1
MRRISILGSTGSIGVSTLRLLEETGRPGEDYVIEALVGGRNVELLAEQALKFRPAMTVLADVTQWQAFRDLTGNSGLAIACGDEAVIAAAARPADWVMAAIVGIAGLKPVWAAAGTGATVALANKESLVCCGRALIDRAVESGGRILPVDSEHNAIFQVLDARQADKVSKLTLTASGGPFHGRTRDALKGVTVEQALKHPNWAMGAKITIDSATLANKGLELIEASYLFDMPSEKIDVVVHPQSVIHSLVEYADGSSLAQLGTPDMRVPISYCLGFPDRVAWNAPRLDLVAKGSMTFHAPDLEAFPMLRLARQALEAGNGLPIVFNAANEVCVQAFLDRRIGFLQIAEYVETAMMRAQLPSKPSPLHASRDSREDLHMVLALETDSAVRTLMQDLFTTTRVGA